MVHTSDRAIRRRNTLLMLAGISAAPGIALSAIAAQPSGKLIPAVACYLAGGLFAALAVREIAGLFYSMKDKPWYAQHGAGLFLSLMVPTLNVLIGMILWRLGLLPSIASLAGFSLLAPATELFGIAVLDWVKAPLRLGATSDPNSMQLDPKRGCPHRPHVSPSTTKDQGERREARLSR